MTPRLTSVLLACTLLAAARGGAQDTLTLADLQRAAIARDPRSVQQGFLRDQSTLRLANLRAERLPTFAVTSQAQHQSDVTTIRIPGARPLFRDTYDASLNARLRLLDPSRTARAATEEAQTVESEARLVAALFPHRQAVADAFFAARLFAQQRAVLEAGIADLDVQLRLARERVAAGASLPGEVALLEAELLRRRQSVDEVATARTATLDVLADLTGVPIADGATLTTPSLDSLVQQARGSRVELRARPEYDLFDAGREVARARADALRAQDRPRLSAFSRTGYGRPGLDMLSRSFDHWWLAGLQLEWAPFDWGIARREREAITLQQRVIDAEERAFRERIHRAAIADAATIDRLTRALASDDAIVVRREQLVQESRIRLTEGVVTLVELVDRETDLQAARLARVTHAVELDQARARFLTTLGIELPR